MNYKTRVAINNPVVFTTINNMFQSQRLAHAFLFSATPGQPIEHEPWYLIEKIIDNPHLHNVAAYVDLIVLAKTKTVISKEEVINAIEKLQQTALTPNGKKILLIQNIENGNLYSLNALLKFIEEPVSNTFIVMTTNHISRVLSTIRSRSQVINVRGSARVALAESLQKHGVKKDRSLILATIATTEEEALKLNETNEFAETLDKVLKAMEHALRRPSRIYTELGQVITVKNYQITAKILNAYFSDIWRAKAGLNVVLSSEKGVLINYAHSNFNYDKALISVNDFTLGQEKNMGFELAKNRMLVDLEEAYE